MWRVSVRGLSCRVTLRLWTCPLLYSTAEARGNSTGAVLDLFCGADRGRVNATDHEGLLGFADFFGAPVSVTRGCRSRREFTPR